MLQLKRAYQPVDSKDGYRILVDRRWPRGVSKETLAVDDWAKDIAPTTPLRKWFHHEPEKYAAFEIAYQAELKNNPKYPAFKELVEQHLKKGHVTLIYGAKDEVYNHAQILAKYLISSGSQELEK